MFGEFFKKYEKWSLLVSILMLILAIFLIAKPLESVSTIIIIFGVILIIDGIICFVNYFRTTAEMRMMSLGLVEGILAILAGIAVIIMSDALTGFLPIILGVWIIVKSLISFQYAVNLASVPNSGWGWFLALSILTLILGIVVVFHPFESASIATRTVGILLAVSEVVDIIESIVTMARIKKA